MSEADSPKPSPLGVLGQLGIAVGNVERFADMFGALLGINDWVFKDWNASQAIGQVIRHRGIPNPEWRGRLAFTKLGGIEIELIEDTSGPSGYQEFVEAKGFGLRHLMFRTDDVEAAIRHCVDRGLVVSTTIADDDGNLIWAMLDGKTLLGFDIELTTGGGAHQRAG